MGRPAYPIIGWTNIGKVSDMVKMDGNQLVGFIVPATFVSTAVTFSMATSSSGTFIPIADSGGSTISFTTTTLTAAYYGFSADQQSKFLGAEIIKMNTGTNEAAGIQVRFVVIPRQY